MDKKTAARETMADKKADAAEAFQNAQRYHRELDEIWRYFMPFRQSTSEQSPERGRLSEGASRTNHLFDGTGLSAAFSFAGNMQADWMPPFEDFFKLEAGPLVPRDARKQLNEGLEPITELVHAVLPRIRLTAHEMFHDLFAGTGAMYMAKGDDAEPVRGAAVPPAELAMEDGPWGDVWKIWWRRTYKARHVEQVWPNGRVSSGLAAALRGNRTATTVVTQCTYWDPGASRWRLCVWTDKDSDLDRPLWDEDFRTSRWLTTRFFKVPGESMGRGLAHLGLPFVKTANKTRELALRAAAFAIMGIWMRRNDGVFNADTAVFKPLAMWQVATTGGPLGASIQRLPVPQDFDVSSIVMADERDQIKRVLLDDELPELEDRVRSPTEIAARLKRYSRNKGGVGARLALELVTPIVRNTIDILETSGKLATNLKIDQLLTQASVTAPAAAAQRADKVERAISWIQMIVGLFGLEAALLVAKVEELLPDVGRWMGIDERFIRSREETEQLRDVLARMVAGMQAGQAKAAPAAPPTPQQYVNGGAL